MKQLPDIYPSKWISHFNSKNLDWIPFRNLLHFKHKVSTITQREDDSCGITYEKALKELLAGTAQFDEKHYETVRNLVRANLHKRGLLTEETYEAFKYDVEGTVMGVDVGKYCNDEPDCVMTPARQYVDFFYELYINISYAGSIPNDVIKTNIDKMLATIEELERQHIHIKITLVFSASNTSRKSNSDFFSAIPLFSHKDFKTAKSMSSVLNERLLRKFYFAVMEDHYKEDLAESYGNQLLLPQTMNIAETFNEVEFFTMIQTAATEG